MSITKPMSNSESLNKLPTYFGKKCIYCGRKYPETVLNIEGHIHHKEPYRCIDTKACHKARKK